jgi:hypothetical protein
MATSGTFTFNARMAPKIASTVRPRESARVYDAWMTLPSAMGSLYGKPTSMSDAPRLAHSCTSFAVVPRSGSPAVMNGMNALRRADFKRAKS